MPGYAGRHTGSAPTAAEGAGRLSLKVAWKAGKHHRPGEHLNIRLGGAKCLHHLGGKASSCSARVAPCSPLMERRTYFVLLKSICLSKHQHEHMSIRNWMEVNISLSLTVNGPQMWGPQMAPKAVFGFTEPLEQKTCEQFPLNQSMPCPKFLPHNQIFWWCFMLDWTN